ncbi:hypothetical protein [Streptomyces sp. enrichment culture]|uniref:hypothetical protein n=1 Tax=Streptomyces sp. enrichment culture TaxID=1795815 RepID=UPI003F57C9C1
MPALFLFLFQRLFQRLFLFLSLFLSQFLFRSLSLARFRSPPLPLTCLLGRLPAPRVRGPHGPHGSRGPPG